MVWYDVKGIVIFQILKDYIFLWLLYDLICFMKKNAILYLYQFDMDHLTVFKVRKCVGSNLAVCQGESHLPSLPRLSERP